jgi:hypothetical protein
MLFDRYDYGREGFKQSLEDAAEAQCPVILNLTFTYVVVLETQADDRY